jgi:hypothetical protein
MKLNELTCSNCGAPLPSELSPNLQIECSSCGSIYVATDVVEDNVVICPECRTINAEDKRYCSGCGQSMKLYCILCHTENPVGTVYCLNCGGHMAQARAKREHLRRERRKHRQERESILREKEERQREEKLQRLLDDLDEPENHDMAIFQINQMGSNAVSALIETLLNDEDPDARYGSARALGQICGEHGIKGLIKARAAKALIIALADPEPAVRYWSSDALAQCQTQTAIEPLAVLLNDPHDGVRRRVRLALQQIGGHNVEELLESRSKGILGWIKGN